MASIIIPARQAVSLKSEGAGDFIFAEGAYQGVIETAEVKPLPSKADGTPFAGFVTTDGERLAIRLGSITPLEGQQDPGARKWFLDLTLSDGKYTVENFSDAPKDAWQLERSAKMIANLAGALQAVTTTDDDNVVVNDGFLEALRAGEYEGTPVGFSVYHKKNNKDATKPYQEIEYFIFAS